MNIVNYRLMGLASRPQLPPLDVKSVIIIIICMHLRAASTLLCHMTV